MTLLLLLMFLQSASREEVSVERPFPVTVVWSRVSPEIEVRWSGPRVVEIALVNEEAEQVRVFTEDLVSGMTIDASAMRPPYDVRVTNEEKLTAHVPGIGGAE